MEQEVTLLSLTAAEVPRCHPKTYWLQKSVSPPPFFEVFENIALQMKEYFVGLLWW